MAASAADATVIDFRERRVEITARLARAGQEIRNECFNEDGHLSLNSDSRRRGMPTLQFWVLVVGLSFGLFLSMLDTSIVATSLYTIGSDLGAMQTINWVALAYTLSYLGFAVTFARLSDVIGRRDAFLTAYSMFIAFSLACALSSSIKELIIFRAFQGVGGSGLYSMVMIILPEVCPRKYLHQIGTVIGLVIAGAGVSGPLVGGLLTKHANWRWIFWINGPVGAVSIILFIICWPRTGFLPRNRQRAWKELDIFGSILLIASAVLIIFAVQNAGETGLRSWGSIVFIAPLAVGVLCCLILLSWECVVDKWLKKSVSPALPISLFRNRFYTAAALSTLFLGFPYLLLIFSFPIRAQVVSQRDSLMAAVTLLPMFGATALGSAISGKINTTKTYLAPTMTIGACFMGGGCGLLVLLSGPADDLKAYGSLALTGLGFGLSTAAATILVSVEAPLEDHAPAHGILAQMRVLGGSLGIATSTILVQGKVKHNLDAFFSHDLMAALAEGSSEMSRQDLEDIRRAYISAFREGMIIAAAVSGAAVLVSLCGYRCAPRPAQAEVPTSTSTSTSRRTSTGLGA